MKKLFFAAAMISTLFCSCEKEIAQDPMPCSAELSFSNVATMDVLTRATATTPYTSSFKINLTVGAEGQAEIKGQEVTYADSKWTLATPIYLQKSNRTLTAWAPAALTPDAAAANVFSMASAKYDATKDLMYAPNMTVNSTNANVALVLEHAYARMTFKLAKTNYAGAGILKALSVEGIVPTAKINITTGTITNPAAAAPLSIVTGGSAVFADQSALVIPAVSATPTVKCTLDGTEYTVALSKVTSLVAGTNYVVTLKISGTEMGVQSVATEDWVESPSDVELK